jgi:usherin
MCNPNGITDQGDCIKDQGAGGQIIGQCFCKTNVIGLKCDVCRPGFANLNASNPDGCSPCDCNTAGTFNARDTCDSESGQCLCKDNVEGLKCDRCRAGTTSLSADNPLGCEGCSCDPIGSVSTDCDSATGLCSCKPGVTGARCDLCLPEFTELSAAGCIPCTCHVNGSVSNVCNSTSGQCPCVPGAVGMTCDSCEPGFYSVSAGCVPCDCDVAGSINGSMSCDQVDGQCNCKTNVRGRTCDTCVPGFTALQESNPDGCSGCDCFSPNTLSSGVLCDPVTSQCECNTMATGLRCERCQDGFYLTSEGCVPCGCDDRGSMSSTCNKTTGACDCQSAGVTGRRCDTCSPGFFQFPR